MSTWFITVLSGCPFAVRGFGKSNYNTRLCFLGRPCNRKREKEGMKTNEGDSEGKLGIGDATTQNIKQYACNTSGVVDKIFLLISFNESTTRTQCHRIYQSHKCTKINWKKYTFLYPTPKKFPLFYDHINSVGTQHRQNTCGWSRFMRSLALGRGKATGPVGTADHEMILGNRNIKKSWVNR